MIKGKDGFYARYIKRMLDIVCALTAIILFCWLYAILAVLVRINLGAPVLFKQARPGLDEKLFTLYKFRTMADTHDASGKLRPDAERTTPFGNWLRSTSLDELPEAWNILKGDMSVIGPRPLLVEYLPYYKPEERLRHTVRPGLSGLAQVWGRNFLGWDERFAIDIKYVNSISFRLDFGILWRTVLVALKRSDIIQYDSVPTGSLHNLNVERSLQEEGIDDYTKTAI